MSNYYRASTLTLEEVLPLIVIGANKKVDRTELNGEMVHVTGLRLSTFKNKSITCVSCGIVGKFFAIERQLPRISELPAKPQPCHLNLYAINELNEEVLMTHDHILARSLGGKNDMSNTQTMCSPCNNFKSKGEHVCLEILRQEKKSKLKPTLKQEDQSLSDVF